MSIDAVIWRVAKIIEPDWARATGAERRNAHAKASAAVWEVLAALDVPRPKPEVGP